MEIEVPELTPTMLGEWKLNDWISLAGLAKIVTVTTRLLVLPSAAWTT